MNLYEILELEQTATELDIKKSYHRLALLYHPDKNTDKNATEKFQDIQSAYQILINPKTRIEYCKLNNIDQSNFVNLLQKIFQNNLKVNELSTMGINFDKNDWLYLEKNFMTLLDSLNFKELFNFFNNGKFPRKSLDHNLSFSETDVINESDSFFSLPLNYQRINKLDIHINLNIELNDILQNNKRKIKIKRRINNKDVINTFIFNIEKPYIVYPLYGDSINNEIGNVIIKLVLQCNSEKNNYIWDDKLIYIEQTMNIYELVYGLDIDLFLGEKKIIITKWMPCRDGFLIELNEINNYIIAIKLVLNYEHSDEKENFLHSYFQ